MLVYQRVIKSYHSVLELLQTCFLATFQMIPVEEK